MRVVYPPEPVDWGPPNSGPRLGWFHLPELVERHPFDMAVQERDVGPAAVHIRISAVKGSPNPTTSVSGPIDVYIRGPPRPVEGRIDVVGKRIHERHHIGGFAKFRWPYGAGR